MKLKKLHIENYKNLKDFDLDFENDNGLSIIVGNNGSGKSNILEAISGIFCEWYGKCKIDFPYEYRIEYVINGRNIVLIKKDDKYVNIIDGVSNSSKKINLDSSYLPLNLCSVYSGEDLRLWHSYFEPYNENYFRNTSIIKHKLEMIYVDRRLWEISFFMLFLYENNENYKSIKNFLNDEIHISTVEQITNVEIKFSFKTFERNTNNFIKGFINKINPSHQKEITLPISKWREIICINSMGDEEAPRDIFSLLLQSFIPETFFIITEIEIQLEQGIKFKDLSEGEKKLIILKTCLEFISDENSLLLLDEPDANIHEARKFALYNLLKKYNNRQTIITSHSPSLVKNADSNELKYLENKNGKTTVITDDKLELIKKLASDQWNIVEAGIFLNSNKYLVLFEGKSDVDFVKQAIKLLKVDYPTYNEIDVDFLNFNGTGNAESFLKNIRDCNPNKKVVIFFDRDDAGKTAMATISNQKKDSDNVKSYNDFISDDGLTKCAFYPLTPEVPDGEFLLEDYFKESLITNIVSDLVLTKKHPVKNLPTLGKQVKSTLANSYLRYSKEDFEGFKVLLDKIYEMTKE